MHWDALAPLQALREEWGKPMTLTSAYRCENHPVEAKKAKGGQHTLGLAVDIQCHSGWEKFKLVELGLKYGAKGIGIAKTFVHLDWREGTPVIWSY